jgi:hypothetical protein
VDKSIFYLDPYDYQSDLSLLKCTMAFQNMTTNIMRFPFWQMVDNSAEALFDIGSQSGCNKLEKDNLAVYTLINIHMKTVTSQIKMGLCFP